jgi:hypothetical protein
VARERAGRVTGPSSKAARDAKRKACSGVIVGAAPSAASKRDRSSPTQTESTVPSSWVAAQGPLPGGASISAITARAWARSAAATGESGAAVQSP